MPYQCRKNASLSWWKLSAAVVLALGLTTAGTVARPASADAASATIGDVTLTGVRSGEVVAYRGIPFAQPPVGELRWQPPRPVPALEGTFDATGFAPHCPQENAQEDAAADEDCLYLNVYVPEGAGGQPDAPLPVMVWIHGGANAFGASDFYDPSAMVASENVIVVTVNYRLGALGFMAHPAINSDSPVNLGVLDQQLALKWVRENIAAFGGDSGRVTLYGESAGALNTLTHLVSRRSHGLFQRAIIQSGGYMLETPTRAEAEARGIAFARRIGCEGDDVALCMRDKPVAEILAGQGTVNTDGAAYFQMVLDNVVLHRSQQDALIAGDFSRVPLLNGATANEGNLFYGDETTTQDYDGAIEEFSRQNHKRPEWTSAVYPIGDHDVPRDAARLVLGDAEFSCPALQISSRASVFVPVFAYEFSDPDSAAGSGHFSDIYYLFSFRDGTTYGIHGSATSQALAGTIQTYWANFARNGNPNGAGLAYWPEYSLDSQNMLRLDAAEISAAAAGEEDGFADRHNCHFWGLF